MDITKEYNIYCDVCGKSQPFSADFETDWTDLICVECRVIVATLDKKIKSNNFRQKHTYVMRTRIISAFPGTGKSYYHKKHPETTLDSDSSLFSWIKTDGEKVRNPEFPNNYIKHIKENIGKYEFIFVSSHKEVRDALLENCLFFYLLYPRVKNKEIYIERYKTRGNDEIFISLISDNWEKWIRECEFCDIGCKQIDMIYDHLEKELKHIIASEGGDKK